MTGTIQVSQLKGTQENFGGWPLIIISAYSDIPMLQCTVLLLGNNTHVLWGIAALHHKYPHYFSGSK